MLFGLEQDRKRQRLRSKNLDTFSDKSRGPRSHSSPGARVLRGSERMAGDAPLELEEGRASPSARSRPSRIRRKSARRRVSNPWTRPPYEKWAINALVAVFLLVFLGVGLDWASVDNPISDALNQYFLVPIRGESTGDWGYNSVNTMS